MSNIADKQRRWLQDRLKQRGRGSRRELARYLGLRDDAITRMLNTDPGKEAREIKHSEVIKMAEFFMSEPPGLAAARTAIGGPHIKVVGHVGAGAEVFPFDDYAQGDGLEEIAPPSYSTGWKGCGNKFAIFAIFLLTVFAIFATILSIK